MATVTNTVSVSSFNGKLKITITETSVDQAANTSQVQVTGTLINNNSGASNGDSGTTCVINGDGHFPGGAFNATVPPSGGTKVFIQHTFTITHGSDGTGTASFTVEYGTTGTAIFGNNKSAGATLTLTHFAHEATAPDNLVVSNVLPTSLTLTWDAPTDDGGWPVSSYLILRYPGEDTSGSPVTSTSTGTTKNLTGLTAGATYTFTVAAFNGHGPNGGYSNESSPVTTQTLAGSWIRVDGIWKIVIPYVRVSGVWKMAVPWIRTGDQWQQTH